MNINNINIDNIDSFFQKEKTFQVVRKNLADFKGTILDLGCGRMPFKDLFIGCGGIEKYIGMDIENPPYQQDVKPDIYWDGVTIPLEDNSINTIIMTDVIEHIPHPLKVLHEVYRVAKVHGMLFATLPFLWPLHDVPHDECRYTPFSLKRMLNSAGFSVIEIFPLGGWNASLATMLGLWLKRNPEVVSLRRELTPLFIKLYKFLIENDKPSYDFSESQMYTGFLIKAYK